MSEGIRKNFPKLLKYYLMMNDKTQKDLVNYLGVSQSAVSNWIAGTRLPDIETISKIAEYLNISVQDLMQEEKKNENYLLGRTFKTTILPKDTTTSSYKSNGVPINILGRVAAGIPIDAIEEIIDTEEIPQKMAATGNFFGLRIKGDSMEPEIHDGDVVIVRQQDSAENDEIVIALINGNDGVCKRLMKYSDSLALISNNPAYKPLYFSSEEIENKPVKIIGKVVELRRKF